MDYFLLAWLGLFLMLIHFVIGLGIMARDKTKMTKQELIEKAQNLTALNNFALAQTVSERANVIIYSCEPNQTVNMSDLLKTIIEEIEKIQ